MNEATQANHHHLVRPSTPPDLGGADSPPHPAGSQVGPILSKLQSVHKSSNGWQAKCPAHDDRNPSLSISEAGDGSVLLKCHAGCTVENIVQVLGIKLTDLFPRDPQRSERRRVVAEYVYRQPDGTPARKVLKYVPKDFRQQGWNGTEWDWKAPKPKLLYHLPELLAAPKRWVLLCEGERDVDKLTSLGFLATCNPGGAGKWDPSYTETLRGHSVAILPDNDPPGHAHAVKVAQALFKAGCEVRVVELPGLKEKEDISDWLRQGHTSDELKAVIREAPTLDETALNELEARWLGGTQQQTSSIAEILNKAGFDELTEGSSGDDIERAIRNLSHQLEGADHLRRMVVREEAARLLSKFGIKAPMKVLDAVLKQQHEPTDDKSIEPEEIEPWPDPINGAELLQEIIQVFDRYLVLPPGGALTQSLWIFASWLYQLFSIFPYLAIISPVKQCGKSNDLDLISFLCNNPLKADSISPSALFRAVEKYHPALFLDEVDTQNLFRNDELRGILNAGHRNSGCVIRSVKVGDDFDVRKFSVYCPKTLALIRTLPDTLKDRSIAIPMRRKRKDEKVRRFRLDVVTPECKTLIRKLARWAQDNKEAVRIVDPDLPEDLDDRAQDNWRPLLSVAQVLGGEWPARAYTAAIALSGASNEEEYGEQLLKDIYSIFQSESTDKLPSVEITEELVRMEGRPWPEWGKNKKPLTVNQLAKQLRPFDIHPKGIRVGNKTPRGYELEDFKDSFSRYIPGYRVQQVQQSSNDGGSSQFPRAQHGPECCTPENASNPYEQRVVAGVVPQEGEETGDNVKGDL